MSHQIGTVPGLDEAIQKHLAEREAASTLPAEQPTWERNLKRALAVLVASAGALLPFLSPTSDAAAFKVATLVVGLGAALGITSRGNLPKQ